MATITRRKAGYQVQVSRFVIVDVTAPETMLRARIAARLATCGDPSEADQAVLTHQLAQNEALTTEESSTALHIDTARSDVEATLREACEVLCARLAAPATAR